MIHFNLTFQPKFFNHTVQLFTQYTYPPSLFQTFLIMHPQEASISIVPPVYLKILIFSNVFVLFTSFRMPFIKLILGNLFQYIMHTLWSSFNSKRAVTPHFEIKYTVTKMKFSLGQIIIIKLQRRNSSNQQFVIVEYMPFSSQPYQNQDTV